MRPVPASVLDARTVIRPVWKSTSRQRRSISSPMRSPAKVSAERIARLGICPLDFAPRSSSPAASSSASICSAESSHTGAGLLALSLRRFPFAGLRSRCPYSTATSRICPRRVRVLLIDVAESVPLTFNAL